MRRVAKADARKLLEDIWDAVDGLQDAIPDDGVSHDFMAYWAELYDLLAELDKLV